MVLNCSYNPNNGNIQSHLDSISNSLDVHLNKYSKILLTGDFNFSVGGSHRKSFYETRVKIL